MSLFLLYYVTGAIIYALSGPDILPNCIFRSITGISCPGCGITHAFVRLLHLDFAGAFQENKLIYVVAPGAVYYLVKDFWEFSGAPR